MFSLFDGTPSRSTEVERLSTVPAFAERPRPIRWLFKDLVPKEACVLIHALPKSGKTWLVFHLALCIAAGKPAFGQHEVEEVGTVLIASPEGGLNSARRRLWGLADGMGIDPQMINTRVHLLEYRSLRLDDDEDYRRLVQTVDALNPSMVIFDPIISFHSRDENSAPEVAGLLGRVRDLQRVNRDLVCVVTHHNTKGSTTSARGSGVFDSWYDVRASLNKKGDGWDSPVTVSFSCRDSQPPNPLTFRLAKPIVNNWNGDYDRVQLEIVEQGEARRAAIAEAAIAFLSSHDEYSQTRTNTRDGIGIGKHDERAEVINKLIEDGTIIARGKKLALNSE